MNNNVVTPGSDALYEAYGVGAIPCKVLEVSGPSGPPNAEQSVKVRLMNRKPKGRFMPRDIVLTDAFRVFPKHTLYHGWKRSMNYKLISGRYTKSL